MSALATHYVQDSSGLVSMRTCCMMWIECSWTCFMLVDTAGSKAVMQTNKKSEIIPDVCVQITSTGSSLYRSTGAVLVSCLSLHSNCISTHASVCFILTVRAYHEEVTEPCKDGQRETERGEKRRTNRCFKPLADTFSICCSLSFFTPFFLNLLFIWCSTLSSSMSWYFMSSFCPNSWTCFDFCPPPPSYLLSCLMLQHSGCRIQHFCLFAFKCQFKLCGLLVMLIHSTAMCVCHRWGVWALEGECSYFLLHFSSNQSLDVFISIWAQFFPLSVCVWSKKQLMLLVMSCFCMRVCVCVHTPVISLCQISLVPRLGIKSKRERERSLTENVKNTVRWWWGFWIFQ